MIIKLSQREIALCKQAAAARWQLARASGVKNQRRDGGRDDSDVDYLGIRAELAVAKLYQLDYSPSVIGIDNGSDVWMGDISVDVKSTFHPTGKLLFKSIEAFKSDVTVLVTAVRHQGYEVIDEMCVVGWMNKEDFSFYAQEVDLGHGLCFVVEQENLSSIESLWLLAAHERSCK